MGSKECDAEKVLNFPEDFRLICEKGLIIGIETSNGQFDYEPKGQKGVEQLKENVLSKDSTIDIK